MKKWTTIEDDLLIEHLNDKKTYLEISKLLNRSQNSVRNRLNKLGYKYTDIVNVSKKYVKCICNTCSIEFDKELVQYKKSKNNNHFCSHSCSATYNNRNVSRNLKGISGSVIIEKRNCVICDNTLDYQKKYCSNICKGIGKRNENYKKIENGDITLHHNTYRNYLIDKYGNKCMECGWSKKNKSTGKVPIQLEHIDGNSDNHLLTNLKLLCPNCHSLTPTFGNLNNGQGRKKRQEKRQQANMV